MDGQSSYPLVPVIPVVAEICDAVPDEPQVDLAWLWRRFCKLAVWFFLVLIVIRRLRLQVVDLRQQANYWRAQHQRAVQREAALVEQVQQLQGEIRELKRRLFGRKSETSASSHPQREPTPQGPSRSRGQQRGSQGHGRRDHDHLPTAHEPCTLPEDQRCCPDCGEPYQEIPGTKDGHIFEVQVRAHRRVYHRHRYRRVCQCPGQPAIITASPPDKVIRKGTIGVSLWVLILQHKYEFFQPLHRVIAELRSSDMHLPSGTIVGGLKKLVPLFQPLYQALLEHNRQAKHWHSDETRWRVFVSQQDKAGFVWYLWVSVTAECVAFLLDPTRAHDVPEKHFAKSEGIMNVDRYSAYKAMAQVKEGKIILAFCWAHVRRDFLGVLTGWPELTDWAWEWIEQIAALYECNNQRLDLEDGTSAYAAAEQKLRTQIEQMRQRRNRELAEPKLRQPQHKVLTSLQEHWAGLTVFVDHPEIPLDNNEAERRQRGPVVARKNYYGSGSIWSGRLAAMLFSLFQTLQMWGMDTGKWLTAYLSACAQARGKPPPQLERYLPWNMTPQERDNLSITIKKPPDSCVGPTGTSPSTSPTG
jgi:transposase